MLPRVPPPMTPMRTRLFAPTGPLCAPFKVVDAASTVVPAVRSMNRRRLILEKLMRKSLLRLAPCGSSDRKSTRLNSSHGYISYAVFCLKKKKKKHRNQCHTKERKLTQFYVT